MKKGYVLLTFCLIVLFTMVFITHTVHPFFQWTENKTEAEEKSFPDHQKPEAGITFYDYLHEIGKKTKRVTIAVIGSSVTKGSGASAKTKNWPGLLEKQLASEAKFRNISVQLLNFGHSGYKAEDLVKQKILDELISAHPDFVIFETSVINNFRQSSSMEDTLFYIDILLKRIDEQLPGTKVLVLAPNPIETAGENQAGLRYEDYVNQTTAYLNEKGYPYINIYEKMNQYIQTKQHQIGLYLADEIHPNDRGYRLWFDILYSHLRNEKYPLMDVVKREQAMMEN